jgi:predicted nucleic acid-binding protein
LIYLDTSVLTAYYCPERFSRDAQRVVRSTLRPSISDLTEVELVSALARKTRAQELGLGEARRVASQFMSHLEANLYARRSVERRHYVLARDWIARFTTPLRALDALHLAVAAADGLQFATADRALARSARTLGIATVALG